jgi:hypothetical protein
MGDIEMDTPATLDPKRKKVLNLVPPPKSEVNERLVNILRETLRDAKAGKIQGIGIALAVVDIGNDENRANESIISYTDGWGHSTLASIAGLNHRVFHERYAAGAPLPPPDLKDDDE